MNEAVPGGHPDQDALADLAAEALPVEQAREVEAHVMSCPDCERLLADAEHVRALLGGADPGPMPDDVWARIESGLTAELSQQTQAIPTRGWFDTARPPAVRGVAADGVAADPHVAVPSPPPALSFDEAPTAAWKAFLTEPPPPPPAEPVQQRVGRAVRSIRSRRDVRSEDQPKARWTSPGVLAGAAAAGVAVLGLGAVGLMALLGGDPAETVTDALPGAGGRQVLQASGTDYTASTLAEKAKALVRGGSAPNASGTATAGTPSAPATVPLKPGTVADPSQLASCLGALGEGDRQAVAVDLARYQGREAAVIVLAGRQGGYDVWVVARDCRPGAEGHLAYKSVPG